MRTALSDSSAPVTAGPCAEDRPADPPAVVAGPGHNARLLIQLRNWANAHLPIHGSLIAYDLALHVLSAADGQALVSLKQLYGKMPYSEAHLRRQLRWLEDGEWVVARTHPGDARNRYVEPTGKMLQAYDAYFRLHAATAARIAESTAVAR